MKVLLFTLISFYSFSAIAEPKSLLDVQVGFGSYTLELKYLFKGNEAPFEGYLMESHDIAILKVDLDTYREDCEKLVEKASLQCIADLNACTTDCNTRVNIYSHENDLLLKELETKEQVIKSQKQKTLIYSFGSGILAALTTGIYFILTK